MFQLNNRFRDVTFVLLLAVSGALITACGGGGGGGGSTTDSSPPDQDGQVAKDENDGLNTETGYEITRSDGITETVVYVANADSMLGMVSTNAAAQTFTRMARSLTKSTALPTNSRGDNAGTHLSHYQHVDPQPTSGSILRSATARQTSGITYDYYLLENEYSAVRLYASNPAAGREFHSVSRWGRETPTARMRGAGSATYSGPVIGYCNACDNGLTGTETKSGDYLVLGGVQMIADFSQNQITGDMSLFAYDADAGLTALQSNGPHPTEDGKVDLGLVDGTITNNGFSGNIRYVLADNAANDVGIFTAISDTEADDIDGDFSGKFYGYNGLELAGIADMQNGDASLEVAFTADRAADSLAAPTNLASDVTGTGNTATVVLTWDAVTNAVKYAVYRDNTLLTTLDAGTTTYTDTPGAAGTPVYEVRAINGDLETPSQALTVTVADDPPVPGTGGGTPAPPPPDTTMVQVGSGTSTIAALTGDDFVTPQAIYSDGSETETLASSYRYYPYDNDDDYAGYIYQAGGNAFYDRETDAGGAGYQNYNDEYRLAARNEDAFSTESGVLAFAGYDFWEDGDTALDEANLFVLEGEYAAAIGWYSNNDGLRLTVGLATPTDTTLPSTGYAVWRGKALGGLVIGTPEDRTDQYSRPQRDNSNGLRGGGTGEMRYFVEGDTTRKVDFADGDWNSYFELRAYEEPTDGRAYWDHLLGKTGTATAEEDVVGTLLVEFDGDISLTSRTAPSLLLDDIDGEGMFEHLADEFNAGRGMRLSYDLGFYGPNLEEAAGDIRLSACSETPTFDASSNFASCGGNLHYLGVGFVEQEAVLPLSTTLKPVQGDTLAEALDKLNLNGVDAEDEESVGSVQIREYENFIAFGLEELEVWSQEYVSFGTWERLVMDETSGEIVSQDGYLYFGDNRVTNLPTTGTATYSIAGFYLTSDAGYYGRISSSGVGSLTANFGAGTNAITGSISSIPDNTDVDSITMTFSNGIIDKSTGTFSGDLDISNVAGFFASFETDGTDNGDFNGAFYDSASYDASVAPDEVVGTLSGIMDSSDNVWTGGFLGSGSGGGGAPPDSTTVQVGSGASTIAELTGDDFVTPEEIYYSGSETEPETLASSYRYYPYDNDDDYAGYIYQAGGNAFYDRETDAGGAGYQNYNDEYRRAARNEDAFSTDSGMLAFAGYDFWADGDTALDDADLFALEGEYAAAIGWYSNNDGLRLTVGLATPTDTTLPSTGYAVYRGKALGGFVVGTPEDRNNQFSRPQRASNGLRGGGTDEMRYFVEGDTVRTVDFADDNWDSYFELRAYEEPTDGRAYWDHLLGETGTATAEENVVGTLLVEFDGNISLTSRAAPFLLMDDIEGDGVFMHLASEFDTSNNRGLTERYDLGFYGPNLEEAAGDLRLSACSEEPAYDGEGHFESCSGDLHYLGVGFVEQEAVLPLSTTPTPTQGDTEAVALAKLDLTGVDSEVEPFGAFGIGQSKEYEKFIEGGLEELEVVSYEYASFGAWERLAMDADGTITPQLGFLYFPVNRVTSLPNTGSAIYTLAFDIERSDGEADWASSFGSSLTANFGSSPTVTGNFAIQAATGSHDNSINMMLTNGVINNDATFSGGLTVSANPTGIFADVNTGANGEFQGAFYDSATYDASAPPDEVAGTFDSVMDSSGNEWVGGFIGD